MSLVQNNSLPGTSAAPAASGLPAGLQAVPVLPTLPVLGLPAGLPLFAQALAAQPLPAEVVVADEVAGAAAGAEPAAMAAALPEIAPPDTPPVAPLPGEAPATVLAAALALDAEAVTTAPGSELPAKEEATPRSLDLPTPPQLAPQPQLFGSAAWVALGLPAVPEPAPAPVPAALAATTLPAAARTAVELPTLPTPAVAAAAVLPQPGQETRAAAADAEAADTTAFAALSAASSAAADLPAGETLPQAAAALPLKGEPRQWQQPLLQALGDRLQLLIAARSEEAQIRLDPPQLGRVDIAIRQEGGELQVRIAASHGEVLRQLQQVSEQLRHDLVQRHSGEVSVQLQSSAALRDEAGRGARDGQTQQQGGQDPQQQQRRPGRGLAEEQQATAETAGFGRAFGRASAGSAF